MWRRFLKSAARRAGYDVIRRDTDVDQATLETVQAVRLYTHIPPTRVIALCQAVQYVTDARIQGDIVECGVWRGGRMLAAAKTLIQRSDTSRTLWLYDTFEAMSDRTDPERRAAGRATASEQGRAAVRLPAVQRTMSISGYPEGNLRFVVGPVEDTIPRTLPDSIALLRLDSDWHESTRHELEHLVPRMSAGAVLIVDDQKQADGARQALDEFMQATCPPILLHRIDDAARIGVLAAPTESVARRPLREMAAAAR